MNSWGITKWNTTNNPTPQQKDIEMEDPQVIFDELSAILDGEDPDLAAQVLERNQIIKGLCKQSEAKDAEIERLQGIISKKDNTIEILCGEQDA